MNIQDVWTGVWDYRSYNNLTFDQVNKKEGDKDPLKFGSGTIIFEKTNLPNQVVGSIGNIKREGWELKLTGSINYGDPYTARFQGRGIVNGEKWIYEYIAYLVNPWQNGVDQVPAFVGSVIRQIPHSGGNGTMHPAGVVGSFFCVKSS